MSLLNKISCKIATVFDISGYFVDKYRVELLILMCAGAVIVVLAVHLTVKGE